VYLERIKEPLIPQYGTQGHEVTGSHRFAAALLKGAVDTAYRNQRRAHIQRDQGSRHGLNLYVGSGAPLMENGCGKEFWNLLIGFPSSISEAC